MKKILIPVLLVLLLLAACQNDKVDSDGGDNFAGSSLGVMTGSTGEMFVEATYPNAKLSRYDSIPDAVVALKSNKLDYVITAYTTALGFVRSNEDLTIIPGVLVEEGAAIAVKKDEAQLLADISAVLARFMDDGTMDDLVERWIKEDGSAYEQVEIPVNPNGAVLTVGVAANREPMCFIERGKIIGLDAELIERIAYELGMRVEYMDMQFSALIAALESGKVSVVISNVTATEERKQKVNFTNDYFHNPQILLARKSAHDSGAAPVYNPDDFIGKTFAIVTGSIWDSILAEYIPGAQAMYFNSIPETVMALKQGKVDATFTGTALQGKFNNMYPDLMLLNPPVEEAVSAFVFSKDIPELREGFNGFIRQIQSNGVYADMKERWMDMVDSPPMPEIETPNLNGRLVFATSGTSDVFTFIQNGKPAGFEVELAYRFAQHIGMAIEIQIMEFAALIPSVQSGKADFSAANFGITEERKQSVDFSDPVYSDGLMVVVRNENITTVSQGFWESLKTSFERNLIQEKRWKMIVNGLQVSVIITVFAFALATLLGFGVCGLRMSKNKLLNAIGNVYITVLRGTPIVVLLMITFYIIFAKSSISGTYVAIIAFGVNGAAFIGEIIRSAIITID
ncbi:MAG: ABC transporter permease subunit, partial [Oscillospiraceae bacterium]|nr:ABC transporter permease subunit [Oscillospiraceae bacterium]